MWVLGAGAPKSIGGLAVWSRPPDNLRRLAGVIMMATVDAIELNAGGVTVLTAGQVLALPAWCFRGWRFLDLGPQDGDNPFVVVADVRLPAG